MLAEINVSSKQRLWAEAVATSVYLRNRLPTRLAEKCQIPYQLWHGKLPSIENLHPFGCLAYANKTKEQIALGKKDEIGTKYSSQTELCIMVGYTSSTKIWKLYSLERHHMRSHKIFTSADVKFDDNIFPNDGGKAPVDNDEGENDDLLKDIENDDPFKDIENDDPFKDIENPNDELDTENDDSDCSDEELEEYSHHHCLNTDLQNGVTESLTISNSEGRGNSSRTGGSDDILEIDVKSPRVSGSKYRDNILETDVGSPRISENDDILIIDVNSQASNVEN